MSDASATPRNLVRLTVFAASYAAVIAALSVVGLIATGSWLVLLGILSLAPTGWIFPRHRAGRR